MRIVCAAVPAAMVLLSMLTGCPKDANPDAGHAMERADSGMVACPANTPEFIVDAEDGLSAKGERGLFQVRLIQAKPEVPAVKEEAEWTIQISDADGKPADVEIAAACAYMPVHGHGLPPYYGIEKLDELGQYKLKGLFFKMSGPWEVQIAIDPATDEDKLVNYTSCDAMGRHPGRDYAVLHLCLADD